MNCSLDNGNYSGVLLAIVREEGDVEDKQDNGCSGHLRRPPSTAEDGWEIKGIQGPPFRLVSGQTKARRRRRRNGAEQ